MNNRFKKQRRLKFESCEARRLLHGDAGIGNAIDDSLVAEGEDPPFCAGDANEDGIFDSADLVDVFQAGEYEDGLAGNSVWAEGDWNGDGDFDSSDLVLAFQAGKYVEQSELFPDVIDVVATKSGDTFRFSVTLSSPYDTPERYADAWRVLAPDGTVLGTRILTHDHQNEQPFTRSLSGVSIPADVTEVTIQGRDQISGWGGMTFTVDVPH